jgi:glyoxylase-like metal-dependent hydrolase (beta-lactamase superfamily II)
MTLEVVTLVLGPVQTNAYLIGETQSKEAVVIDPAWDGKKIIHESEKRGWRITHVWLTHAHFDHFGGVAEIVDECHPSPSVALHEEDLPLWKLQGGAPLFGFRIDPGPEPGVMLRHGQKLYLGKYEVEVRHAPGHTRGHVVFYIPGESLCFCGDVIFRGSIGRTDLPGGDYHQLLESIHLQILTLPDEVRLLSGHGPESLVGIERLENPFL